jgi:hypothetical protein
MMNKGFSVIFFAAGFVTGAVVAVRIVKDKYEKIAQEEIDSVKEAFAARETTVSNSKPTNLEKAEYSNEKPSLVEYAAKLRDNKYVNYSKSPEIESAAEEPEEVEEQVPTKGKRPYVISPDEFGDIDEYRQISLTYYADSVLADENDEMVEYPDKIVGLDSLKTFGRYEEDAAYVRNDRLRSDYEILADERKYTDVVATLPHRE